MTEYLVVGNITVDYTPVGREWGGTALFAAMTALRLGARVHVLTSMPQAEVRRVLPEEIAVRNVDSPVFCTFLHKHVDGVRDQFITDVAQTLHLNDLPETWRCLPLVHFGPIAQEVGHDLLGAFEDALRGGSVQGWLRHWGQDGHVQPLSPEKMLAWVPPVDCSFLSEEDIGPNRQVIDVYRRAHKVVVLTDGAHGATVFEGDSAIHIPAFPVQEVDDNGAGDVFSAAFLIRYYETGNAREAAEFASVVASFHVEHIGTEGLPTRDQVDARLQEYARLRR